jgi:hypothetical protein
MQKAALLLTIAVISSLSLSSVAFAYTERDVDRLTTLAVIYGRAVACGADVEASIRRTGSWIDSTFESERGAYQFSETARLIFRPHEQD